MRSSWLILALFLVLGIANACRTPADPPGAGCTWLASGLQHCSGQAAPR